LQSADREARRALVGEVYTEQRRGLYVAFGMALCTVLILWSANFLDSMPAALLAATLLASMAALQRNFFRLVLLAHRRPHDVLLTDLGYAALLIAGVWLATRAMTASIGAVVAMGAAAVLGAALAASALRRFETWKIAGESQRLREFAPLALWSLAGAGVHWTFSQGYSYLAAHALDVSAVAAIAATRLTLMPINLLSMGVGALMLPLTVGWLARHSAITVLQRLAVFALGIALLAIGYIGILWWSRDWLFATVLRKTFEHRDALLMLWALVFLLMTARDQLIYLLVARQRFRDLTLIGIVGAVVSLTASYLGMLRWGVIGAPLGVLVGESINLAGIVALSLRHASADTRTSSWVEATS